MTAADYRDLENSIREGDAARGKSIALQLVDDGVDPLRI